MTVNQHGTMIRNARILTMDPTIGDLERGDLLIEGGLISALAPRLEADRTEEIDATGCIVLPGFIDSHRHMWQAALRGCAPHHTLPEYFSNILGQLAPVLTPQDLYLGNLLSARAALDAGVTTVQDISNIQDSPAHSDHLIQALRDSGLRTVFAYGNSTPRMRAHGSSLPDDVRRIRAQLLPRDDGTLVTMALITEAGDDEAERHNARLARDLGLPTARHAVQFSVERHVTRMRGLGVLLPGTTFIHGVGLDTEELKVIADNGSSLSIAPAIEMMMGHGYPPFTRAAEAGLRLSLSADVEVTSAADMFTQMRAAYQASRYSELSSPGSEGTRTTVKDILRYATAGGAQALGLDHLTGSLTPGKQADLIILRADQPDVAPVYDAYSTVVLQMDRSHIDTVLVAGQPAKRGGKPLADTSALIDDANALVRKIIASGLLKLDALSMSDWPAADGPPSFRAGQHPARN
jgi:cytosine/adenosine deaminase-related metal-dependent hydrolase